LVTIVTIYEEFVLNLQIFKPRKKIDIYRKKSSNLKCQHIDKYLSIAQKESTNF